MTIGGIAVLWSSVCLSAIAADVPDVAVIRPDLQTGFANAGWKYDRYQELPTLDAHKTMSVADLKGPGIIRHLHVTRHQPKDEAARGVVLEIWFDDAKEPAVQCPLADFFGDGCNGRSMHFASSLIECPPWSYNAYFAMPFKSRARVLLRNDTDKNLMDYSYVEWENLPGWNDRLGYFHATYRRKCFQLCRTTDETFFDLQGTGHLLGRQYSVVTDEPLFREFGFVMEGNNEVDIDGQARKLDYLGTEDSFTYSWGFQQPFIGPRAGMPLVKHDPPAMLSIYRFHEHQPIRFNRSLRWHINWSQEKHFFDNKDFSSKLADAMAKRGCWVDYATVYYWYQSVPGGFQHVPLAPAAQRAKLMLRPALKPSDLGAIVERLSVDPQPVNTFATRTDLDRVYVAGAFAGTHPFWIDQPKPAGGHPGNPNPGRQGILATHASGEAEPCFMLRRVRLPAAGRSALRIVVSGDPYEMPGKSDCCLQAGVWDGKTLRWFDEETVDAGTPPSPDHWRTFEYDLAGYSGRTVGLIVRVSYGGPKGVGNEEAFFDEISVVCKP